MPTVLDLVREGFLELEQFNNPEFDVKETMPASKQ